MFMITYFKHSFDFIHIFEHLKPLNIKLIIYFLFISLISAFPLNYQVVSENGFRLNFIEEDFNGEFPIIDEFPCTFSYAGMNCDEPFMFLYKDITYVFDQESPADSSEVMLFNQNNITYIKDGITLQSRGYEGFSDTLDMHVIIFGDREDIEDAFNLFASGVEQSFGSYIVLYTLFTNIMVQIVIQSIFVLFLVFVLRLFKFGLSTFMTINESFSFVIMMMTLPAVLSVGIALIEPVFASVLYQFLVGIVIMIVMLKIGRKHYK
jgi:maltodextrin utilization protein YvdJ